MLVVRWQVELVMVGDFHWKRQGMTAGGLRESFRQGYAVVVLKCSINRREGDSQPLDIVSGKSTKEFGSS